MPKITIAINGCSHGEFHNIFHTIQYVKEKHQISTDILLCCGDFEAIRPEPFPDLQSMACPEKYLKYGDFVDYYNASDGGINEETRHSPQKSMQELERDLERGNEVEHDTEPTHKHPDEPASTPSNPLLENCPTTLFIGGNHESAHYLAELPYGGWVSQNIYYLGRCGTIRFGYSEKNSVLIGGLSGIFKPYDFEKGLFEKYPLDANEKRSVYHVRLWDQWRLDQLKSLPEIINGESNEDTIERVNGSDDDIADSSPIETHTPSTKVSHQWNIGMSHEWPLNVTQFADRKHLEQDLYSRQRKTHFRQDIEQGKLGCPVSRHLFDAFEPDYWFSGHMHCDLALECKHPSGRTTKFLALDKVIPRRKFLQFIEVDLPEEPKEGEQLRFFYDRYWLSVIKATHNLTPTTHKTTLPDSIDEPLRSAAKFIEQKIQTEGEDVLQVPLEFRKHEYRADDPLFNPYTTRFFREFGLNPEVINEQVRRSLPPQYEDFSRQHQRGHQGFHREHQHAPHRQHGPSPNAHAPRPDQHGHHQRNGPPTRSRNRPPAGRGGRGGGWRHSHSPSPHMDQHDHAPHRGRGGARGGHSRRGQRQSRSPPLSHDSNRAPATTTTHRSQAPVNPEEIDL